MSLNYRETKNELIHCPFNPYHLVKRCRMITHTKICPDKETKAIVNCPYNPSHHVTKENLEKHKAKCPDKVCINSKLEKEMEEYIKNSKKKIENDKPKENTQANCPQIIGLNPKLLKKKKKNKKKTKKIEEKSIDFEHISNKQLINAIFNENVVMEYNSDSSEDYEEIPSDDDETNN